MIESLRAERIAFNNAARTRGEEPTFESFIAARRRSELLSPRAQAMAGQEQTSDHSSSKEQEREKQEDDDPSEETLALAHSDVRHLTQTARHAETPEDYKKWLADAMAVAAQAEALQANRRGAFDEAQRIVAQGMAAVRALAPDDTVVREIVARLDGDRNEFAAAMSPQELKRRHFMSYNVSGSRDAEAKARRTRKAPSAV